MRHLITELVLSTIEKREKGESRKVKIKVNNIELEIFEGAKVKDALRLFYARQNKQIPKQMPIVRDDYGHRVGEGGALLPDAKLWFE